MWQPGDTGAEQHGKDLLLHQFSGTRAVAWAPQHFWVEPTSMGTLSTWRRTIHETSKPIGVCRDHPPRLRVLHPTKVALQTQTPLSCLCLALWGRAKINSPGCVFLPFSHRFTLSSPTATLPLSETENQAELLTKPHAFQDGCLGVNA